MSYYLVRSFYEATGINTWKVSSIEEAKEKVLSLWFEEHLDGDDFEIWEVQDGSILVSEKLISIPNEDDLRAYEIISGPVFFGKRRLDNKPIAREEIIAKWQWEPINQLIEDYRHD